MYCRPTRDVPVPPGDPWLSALRLCALLPVIQLFVG